MYVDVYLNILTKIDYPTFVHRLVHTRHTLTITSPKEQPTNKNTQRCIYNRLANPAAPRVLAITHT